MHWPYCDVTSMICWFYSRRVKNAHLKHIRKLLDKFEGKHHDDNDVGDFVNEVRRLMLRKKAGKVLTLALDAPHFFRLGPLLFARKIANMVPESYEQERGPSASQMPTQSLPTTEIGEYIYDLDKAIRDDPVKLGFSSVSWTRF